MFPIPDSTNGSARDAKMGEEAKFEMQKSPELIASPEMAQKCTRTVRVAVFHLVFVNTKCPQWGLTMGFCVRLSQHVTSKQKE